MKKNENIVEKDSKGFSEIVKVDVFSHRTEKENGKVSLSKKKSKEKKRKQGKRTVKIFQPTIDDSRESSFANTFNRH
jgi:hypothetical protein